MFTTRLVCLITFIHTLLIVTSSADQIICKLQNFSVGTEIDNRVYVSDAGLTIDYNRNELAVYQYPATNAVNILMNKAVITFAGVVVNNDKDRNTKPKTSQILISEIKGSAHLTNEKRLSDCLINVTEMPKENTSLTHKLDIEILRQATACTKASICSKVGNIIQQDFKNAVSRPFDFGSLAVIRNYTVAKQPNSDIAQKNNFQSSLNVIVDTAINEIVEKIKKRSEGSIKIADINLDITEKSSWKPEGKLEAKNGTFSDLTTFTRTKDATLSHDGLRFIVSCGFSFSKAKIEYDNYKLKYGVSVSGRLSATIDGVSFITSIIVDCKKGSCRITLEKLRMEEMGKIKIKVTGLGPLNNMLSRFATWITKKWKEEIIEAIENKMKNLIQEQLTKFGCGDHKA